MTQRLEFVVYLSSTLADLEEERKVALEAIAGAGRVQTSFRADEQGVIEACVGDVRKCALYVGILGQRYGYVPVDPVKNPDNLSITELEYRACRQPGQPEIPRLMFIKSTEAGISGAHIDALSHPETAERMRLFLERAGKDQTAFVFKNLEQLGAKIETRVQEHANRFHAENVAKGGMLIGSKPWSRQLVPVYVACLRGTDHARRDRICSAGDPRFRAGDLQVRDDDFMASFDAMLRQAQAACLLVTPAALDRITNAAGPVRDSVERVAHALRTMRTRLGLAVMVCEGVTAAQLPASWDCDVVVELPADQLLNATPAALATVYDRLKVELPGLTLEPRLPLPYVVVAPTLDEVASLCASEPSAFDKFQDATVGQLWHDVFVKVQPAARKAIGPEWPNNTYGATREAWRCFGPAGPTVRKLVEQAVERINEAPPGSRERRFLRTAKLVAHRYELDEFRIDQWGSRRALEAVRDQGCLFVVDEVGLLHPDLRPAADTLLDSSRSAIVAVCPCDPGHTAMGLLLNEPSYLRVGSIVTRFRTEQDPRCEVALNSSHRLERWLRLAIPELVASQEDLESNPQLVARASSLFAEDATAGAP